MGLQRSQNFMIIFYIFGSFGMFGYLSGLEKSFGVKSDNQ